MGCHWKKQKIRTKKQKQKNKLKHQGLGDSMQRFCFATVLKTASWEKGNLKRSQKQQFNYKEFTIT